MEKENMNPTPEENEEVTAEVTEQTDEAAADVTGDGKLTRNDLLRLAKYFSGFDVVLGA